MERTGGRYFQLDEGYDKRVYENDCCNILRIWGTFILFYVFNILHWWGTMAFGSAHANTMMWFSVACFLFTLTFLGGMLISGHFANKKLAHWEHLLEKINDYEQLARD
jgi:hypothetical protein